MRRAEARIRPIDCFLSVASGAFLALAQPPAAIWWLAWVGLVPALIACRDKSPTRRFLLGLVCGATWAWMFAGLWLWPATREALAVGWATSFVLALAAVMLFGGLYVTAFLTLWDAARRRVGAGAPLVGGALWVALELARAHLFGGYPWGLLGHTQWQQVTLIQVADFAGVYGASFLLAAANVVVADFLTTAMQSRVNHTQITAGAVLLLMTTSALLYGAWRLSTTTPAGPTVAVQLVHTAWSEKGVESGEKLFAQLVELTSSSPTEKAEIVVWPENSIRFYVQTSAPAISAIEQLLSRRQQYLVAGGPRFEAEGEGWTYYNSVHLFGPRGERLGQHDKAILVPLAEHAIGFLPAVERPFRRGGEIRPLRAGDQSLGMLVCFEAIYPEIARDLVRQGATMLVNVTNDYLVGAGAMQQAAMAVFRAIENRAPLLRVANLGPTLSVDPVGRVTVLSDGATGSVVAAVKPGAGWTPYNEVGDLFAFLCVGMALVGLCWPRRSRANSRS